MILSILIIIVALLLYISYRVTVIVSASIRRVEYVAIDTELFLELLNAECRLNFNTCASCDFFDKIEFKCYFKNMPYEWNMKDIIFQAKLNCFTEKHINESEE